MTKGKTLSLAQAKNLPTVILLRMINRAKKFLKEDKIWQDECKKWGEDPSIIDIIPVCFGKLDVSGKTLKGVITLNIKMLTEENPGDAIAQYLVHECVHALQQTCSTEATKSSDDGEYLKNKHEQDAFSTQIALIDKHKGKEEAVEYASDLISYHDIDNKDKKQIENKLLSKID